MTQLPAPADIARDTDPHRGPPASAVVLGAAASVLFAGGSIARAMLRNRAARLTAPPGVRARDRALPEPLVHVITGHDGARLVVRELGDRRNPTVLLTHGLTNQWWLWTGVAELLADHHLVIPDVRGHGESDPGTDGMQLPALGRDVATVLRELDLRDTTLVGYSLGGMAVLRFLVDHPGVAAERVRGVALIATTAAVRGLGVRAGGAVRTSPWTVPTYRLQAKIPALKPRYGEAPLWTVLLGAAAYSTHADGAAVQDLMSMHAQSRSAITAAAVQAMAQQDVRDRLHRVTVPTTVIVGADDVTIAPGHSHVIADGIEGATLVLVDGARHGIVLERPATIAGLIRDLTHDGS
jgi:non-heme chloroperoxidase